MSKQISEIKKDVLFLLSKGRWSKKGLINILALKYDKISDIKKCINSIRDMIKTNDLILDNPMEFKEKVIIHLSDLHVFCSKYSEEKQLKINLNSFYEECKEINEKFKPTVLIISGDISETGSWDEYTQAIELIKAILSYFPFISLDRLILVPGNHDVNRNIVKTHRFNNYIKFSKYFYPFENDDPLNYTRAMQSSNSQFIVFNTNEFCLKESPHKIEINNYHFDRIFNQILENNKNNKEKKILVTHHPLRLIQNFSTEIVPKLRDLNVILCLHGHEHIFENPQFYLTNDFFPIPTISAGSASTYYNKKYLDTIPIFQFNIIKISNKIAVNNYAYINSAWRNTSVSVNFNKKDNSINIKYDFNR